MEPGLNSRAWPSETGVQARFAKPSVTVRIGCKSLTRRGTMERIIQSPDTRSKAKQISLLWAKWQRKNGKKVKRAQRVAFESDLDSFLQKYGDYWGMSPIEMRLNPISTKSRS
jgi:hypothetical protein